LRYLDLLEGIPRARRYPYVGLQKRGHTASIRPLERSENLPASNGPTLAGSRGLIGAIHILCYCWVMCFQTAASTAPGVQPRVRAAAT
jgi:hypothetical protein